MSAVMFEGKDMQSIGKIAVVDGVRKARHQVSPHVALDNWPALTRVDNDGNGTISLIKKLHTQCCHTIFVILRGLD